MGSINQKVSLTEMPAVVDVPDLLEEMRNLQKVDRELMDKANRAFVSYVQSYVKHECKMILRVKDLNLGAIATSYGLLKMPKMPELRNITVSNFSPVNIDFNEIKYKDSEREKSRQGKLAEFKKTGCWPGFEKKRKVENNSWSKKVEKLEKRRAKKLKRLEKRQKNKSDDAEEDLEDEDDFAKDFKTMKKLKKGQISQEDFDAEFSMDKIATDC